jgi:DMSO/TMAO reductase YedYZ molybdopterin-dependent catalytic subunit
MAVFPSPSGLTRRQLIRRLAAAGFTAPVISSIVAQGAWADDGTPTAAERLEEIGKDPILIERGSTTFETPLDQIDGLLTPNELFFIRSNGPIAVDIDPEEWRLSVTGLVDEELELSLQDLQEMPSRTVTAFLECSGNSRGRFEEQDGEAASGTQWGNGAVGNAEWTGVPLAEVLLQSGLQEGAVEIVSQGGDFEEMRRAIPVELALNPNVLLAWEMNGEPLPNPHGGPIRLFVPDWGGIASTKWIVGLEVIDRPFEGPFQSESYVIIDEEGTVVRPVREMPVKSVITEPGPGAEIGAGSQTIAGYAWSGYGGITVVEVSTDGGENWDEAEIVLEAGPLSWVRFEYEWDAQEGETVLQSRASDQRGFSQPTYVPWNQLGYQMNAIYDVPVVVA